MAITDDDLFEGEEMYCLTLQSSDPDITTGSTPFTCIVITDGDSKLRYSLSGAVIIFFWYIQLSVLGFNHQITP